MFLVSCHPEMLLSILLKIKQNSSERLFHHLGVFCFRYHFGFLKCLYQIETPTCGCFAQVFFLIQFSYTVFCYEICAVCFLSVIIIYIHFFTKPIFKTLSINVRISFIGLTPVHRHSSQVTFL